MPGVRLPDFDGPALAQAVERLDPARIDTLPFGVVRLDADGAVRFFSRAEQDLSGFGEAGGGARGYRVHACGGFLGPDPGSAGADSVGGWRRVLDLHAPGVGGEYP